MDHDHITKKSEVASLPPILEQVCQKCHGSGIYSAGGGERERCVKCRGTGYIPTDYGFAIVKLMEHYFRPFYDNMRAE